MKNAIVWGASGEIGQAILRKLNAEGWTTVGVARNSSRIPQFADYIFEAEFDDPGSIEQTVYFISQEIGEVNIWCYAAGDISYQKISEMAPQDWNRIISANLSDVFYTYHHSVPLLDDAAHIFVIGAVSERLRLPGLSAYAAAKAGVEAFAEALSKEERKKRITLVRPGAVATSFWDKVPLRLPKDAAPPEKVAEKLYEAYQSGHKGQLNLV